MKKVFAIILTLASLLSLTACGGGNSGSGSGSDNSASGGGSSDTAVSITIFNSKNEIQPDLEEAAAAYSAANGVNIEVYYSQDTVAAHLATRYAAKDPYTINMVDAKDVYTLGAQYGYDMSNQLWAEDTDYGITVDGKLVGFPVCVEARGILYNADAIKATLGEDFDPTSIQNLDQFKAYLDRMAAAGMEYPVGILKPDWSLAAHYLQHVYEEHADVDGFVQDLYDGKVDLMQDAKFNALMDTFDVLKQYNMFKTTGPISVEDDQVHQALSEGVDAFQFGGCWEWNDIIDYDYTGNIGLMPIPQNMNDEFTGKMVVFGSKYFYVDNSENTTQEQRDAACSFLNWLAMSDDGRKLVSETCAMISPFKSNNVPCANDIGVSVKKYTDAGMTIASYDYAPDDHYSKLGAEMQRYLADQCTRQELADAIEAYWASTTPVQH